jgi:hypothetical protein
MMTRTPLSMARHVVFLKKMRIAYNTLVGKPDEERPHGRTRNMWEDNIKINLNKIG